MRKLSIQEAQLQFGQLARDVEAGETIVVTRDGRPVMEIVPAARRDGLDFDAGRAFLKSRGVDRPVPFIAVDFDAPLDESALLGSRAGE